MRDGLEEGFVTKTNIERITNGIFAFTMTLLARNIILPPESTLPETGFLEALLEKIGPGVANFIIAFLVLAMLWFFVYQIYRNITAVDRSFAYLLMLFLLAVVSIPFSSQIDIAYANPAATAIFEGTLAFLGFLCIFLWLYATRSPRIINPGITRRRVVFQALKYAIIPLLSFVALYISLTGELWGDAVYLFAPVIYLVIFREKLWKLDEGEAVR